MSGALAQATIIVDVVKKHAKTRFFHAVRKKFMGIVSPKRLPVGLEASL
jgi:hypothetical protein